MSQRNDQEAGLGLARAAGKTVAAWAKDNDVPRRTAFSRSKSPEVRRPGRRDPPSIAMTPPG
jgi:hypothetical protein